MEEKREGGDVEETRLVYFLEDSEDKVPYLIKLNVAPDQARLRDVKRILNSNGRSFKFFFKTNVPDLGIVKEELIDDNSKLPIENGRVVLHLVPIESTNTKSQTNLSEYNMNNRSNENNNYNNPSKNEYGQFSSMNSLATSSGSSSAGNNENKMKQSNYGYLAPQQNNLNHQQHHQMQQQQHRKSKSSNYDSLTRKQNQQQQHRQTMNTPLKEFNFDDTSTETESLVDEFNGLKMIQQHNKVGSQQHHHHHQQQASTKRHLSLNNHQNGHHHNHQPAHHGLVRGGSLGGNQHGSSGNNGGHYYHHHHGHHPYHNPLKSGGNMLLPARSTNKQFDTVSMLSENETTTFFDTLYDDEEDDDDDDEIDDEDDHVSSISGTTATTATSSVLSKREKRRKMSSRRYAGAGPVGLRGGGGGNFLQRHNSMHSSMSSLADSTMSINIITVRLNMDSANFLGISIVGQSNKTGEGGIYVGSIMQGGAVAQDGQIDAGDMILQVNDISFEKMSNDEAVRVLREAVAKAGPLKLVVAKCWESLPKGYFQVSKQDKVYPINPQAWVAHTQAHTQAGAGNKGPGPNRAAPPFLNHSVSSLGSTASFSTFANSTITSVDYFGPRGGGGGGNYQQQLLPHRGNNNNQNNHYGVNNMPTVLTSDSTRFGCTQELNLTAESDMELIMRTMGSSDSGLDIRERNWLKITIPDAFIGRDVVDWLFNHVEGFPERRDAQKYASMMLKNGYIRSAVNRPKFSEHSYYVFGDQTTFITQNGTQGGQAFSLFTVDEEHDDDFDSVSEYDRDSNNYAPMSFPPPPQNQPSQPQLMQAQGFNKLQPASSVSSSSSTSSTQPPGLTFNHHNQMQHQHFQSQQQQQGKIYSNIVVGIGGPGSNEPSNMMGNNAGAGYSSSSSNVTSNSTSTTSHNTTASASNIGVISSEHRANSACQLYYPTPALFNTNINSKTNSSLSQFTTPKPTTGSNSILNDQTTINDTITTQINAPPPNSFLSQSHNNTTVTNSVVNNTTKNTNMLSATLTTMHERSNGGGGGDNRSLKSSDNSSSGGNASDQELISSSSRSKISRNNKSLKNCADTSSNYYDFGRISSTNGQVIMSTTTTTMTTTTTAARALDKVPKDVRLSKQSFCQAMENPCEFFVDVM